MCINFCRFSASLTLMLSLGVAFPLMTSPSFASTKASTESQTCENPDLLEAETSTDQFSKVFNWLVNPEMVLADVIHTVGYQMIVEANTRPSPWPTIHDRARLARVPVMMYHDILPKKKVSFDLTIKQFKGHLEAIKENGLTPISLDQLTRHLQTGESLPKNPIVLTFDDGYVGHYEVVYPLLKEYNYPGAFSIYTDKVDGKIVGRSTVTWEQLKEMAADPLITIISHGVTHPKDLSKLSDWKLQQEVFNSKQRLEDKLSVPIRYFTYPEGNYDERVTAWIKAAGYEAAFTMEKKVNKLSNHSKSLLAIDRFGQAGLKKAIAESSEGMQIPIWKSGIDFNAPIVKNEVEVHGTPLILISGGKPITIHADSRYPIQEIVAKSDALAGVDGAFFSLKTNKSNRMIGPIFSQINGKFVPGSNTDNAKLRNRPLVLINSETVRFIPFHPDKHNTLKGIQAEMPDVTDAFVAGGYLVKNSQARTPESFGGLFDFDAPRHRAFWGIHRSGQPIIGVSTQRIDSITLSQMLAQVGFRDAVMLDSGASTSLAYKGKSMVKKYKPRPVPHVVALLSPEDDSEPNCVVAKQ